ncbi:MAG: AAA family ATPase, partial [Verrucomicrobia bacterium]|nr:AAA family ATPase [Verrucomicrobiota bacterium]
MITLNIKNFKCFYGIEVPINELTVFAGGNGNGKSTAIQALLLLRRTIEHCSEWKGDHFEYNVTNNLNVELNEVYCLGLGNSLNILPSEFKETEIELGLSKSENGVVVKYSTNNLNELWITPTELIKKDFQFPDNPLMFQEFYYLNAERIGPRINQGIKFYDYPNVGFKGEFTAQIIADLDTLETESKFQIDNKRVLSDSKFLKGSKFQHHVNAWLSYIIDGVTIVPVKDSDTHTARIAVENSFSKGKSIFPTNTGFGISYSLPIIVSCLLAKKDTFLIIENPEAHLHPSAQSKMGFFLGVMANSGIKIVVETHSDHIINGIQIAVAERKINNELVTINFFSHQENSTQPEVQPIKLKEKGE